MLQINFSSFLTQINLSISILDTVDTTTGHVLTPAPDARVVTIRDSHIIWQVFADMIWNLSLAKVWEELKNYKLPWKHLSTKQCLINFVVALVLFCMSNFDVYSDGIVAHDYIAGANYFFMLTNDTLLDISKLDCTNETYNAFYGLSNVNCFAKDPAFGYGTLALMFAPGKSFFISRAGNSLAILAIHLVLSSFH